MLKCPICDENCNLAKCLRCSQHIACSECLDQLKDARCPFCRNVPLRVNFQGEIMNINRKITPNFNNQEYLHLNKEFICSLKRLYRLYNQHRFPVYDISDRVTSDYIDYLTWEEVKHGVIQGIDCYARPFWVLKLNVESNTGEVKYMMQTFFQRYRNDPISWQGCGHATKLLMCTSGGMTSEQINQLYDLIEGKTVLIDNWKCRIMSQTEVNQTEVGMTLF